jgi:hypothetical protein
MKTNNVYQIHCAANAGMAIVARQLAGVANMPEPRLARARRIAAEVRAKRPEMQVRWIVP